MVIVAETAIATNTLFPDRYGYKSSTVYKALSELQIERFKRPDDGVTTYLTVEDLQVLDGYMEALQNGGRKAAGDYVAGYLGQPIEESTAIAPARRSTANSMELAMPSPVIELVQAAIAQLMQKPVDTLSIQRQLKEAAEEDWILSTGQVKEIMGVSSWSGEARYGFAFERYGKVGRSNGWRVSPSARD